MHPSTITSEIPRRPVGRQLFRSKPIAPSLVIRRAVSELAREHHATRSEREFGTWAARRLGLGRTHVERVLIGRLVEVETAYESLRSAVRSAVDGATEDGAAVWEDLA